MKKFLKVFKKISFLAAALAMFQTTSVSADSADDLQAALSDGIFTFRYENVTPPSQSNTPKEKTRLVQSGSIYSFGANESDFTDPYMRYQIVSGIVTADGKNCYSEFSSRHAEVENEAAFDYSTCSLTLGNELFKYRRTRDAKGVTQYVSDKGKNKVEATSPRYNSIGYKVIDFGDLAVGRLITALLPGDKKPLGSVVYQKVKTGKDSDGLEYADFKASNISEVNSDVFLDVIRYYFKDGQLVKIYAGRYSRDDQGKVSGTRTIVNITEFIDAPQEELLKLPAGLTDVTKREK